jgi:hypothetical protein
MNICTNSASPLFLSAGAIQYVLLVAVLYVIGAGLYAGKQDPLLIMTLSFSF